MCVLLLASPELPQVELQPHVKSPSVPLQFLTTTRPRTHLEFPSLKDVAVRATRLTRSAADHSVQPTSGELGLQERVDLRIYTNPMATSSGLIDR